MIPTVPIVLFTYARPCHLKRTLACLRENSIPLLYVFSDSPKTPDVIERVNEVRQILREIDWCEVYIVERTENLGLGKSILTGVTDVLQKHDAIIVFEDDLVCVPGTYQYLCAALEHYKDDPRVMSVTGWTHPRVTPSKVTDQPYFDGRAECWVWGVWAESWRGMEQDAMSLLRACEKNNIDVYRYGADLPEMAKVEGQKNIWAVRFLYLHMLNRGLCLRPPHSMVNHIGFDSNGTNATGPSNLSLASLEECPSIPVVWPTATEHIECPSLWQKMFGAQQRVISVPLLSMVRRLKHALRRILVYLTSSKRFDTMTLQDLVKLLTPPLLIHAGRRVVRTLRSQPMPGVSSIPSAQPDWEYIPEGWAYARTHPEVKGWNVQEVLESNIQKWSQFVRMVQGSGPLGVAHESALTTNEDITSHNIMMAFAYTLVLAARKKDRLSILDWGGGIGHYYVLAQALLPGVEIEYHCKDVPVLAEHGASLFPDAYFHTDDACLGRSYDFVLVSTSLQYAENWRTLLKDLASATSNYLYIANLPIVKQAPSFVFIQRPYQYGYNTEYLAWCLNQTEFLQAAEEAGLHLLREFVYGHQPFVFNAPEQNVYRGHLFQARPKEKA